MQLLLPIFPHGTKLISDQLGVFEQDGQIHYLVNGLTVYSHAKDDLQSFRYITSNMLVHHLCTQSEVIKCFGVSEDSVRRSLNKYRNGKEQSFFSEEARHGHSHKLHKDVLEKIQKNLDQEQSVNSIAKSHHVSEGAIRYAIKKGYLKKSLNQRKTRIRVQP